MPPVEPGPATGGGGSVSAPAACLSARDLLSGTVPDGPLAVLGWPVRHSLSPAMHEAALQALGATRLALRPWRYRAIEVEPGGLPSLLPRLHEAGYGGLNLTVPHKVDVLDMLEEVDPGAAEMGAVNTLIRTPTGFRGANTDGVGLEQAVQASLGRGLAGARVLLLGAGGAARAIAVQCLRAPCASLALWNRSPARRDELLARLRRLPDAAARLRAVAEEEVRHLKGPLLVINATSLGLKSDDPVPIDLAGLPPASVVYDTTYGTENQLQRSAHAAGLRYADGLAMLVGQGARSFSLWTGIEPPVSIMAQAAREALRLR